MMHPQARNFASNSLAAQPLSCVQNQMSVPGMSRPVFLQETAESFFRTVQLQYQELDVMEHNYDTTVEEVEPMQICNLNENVLRLEELVQKKGMTLTLNNEDLNGDLYEELVELNSRTNTASEPQREVSLTTSCLFTGRRFSGLKSEDVDLLDERILTQLIYEFGLENVRELPVLRTEAIKNYL